MGLEMFAYLLFEDLLQDGLDTLTYPALDVSLHRALKVRLLTVLIVSRTKSLGLVVDRLRPVHPDDPSLSSWCAVGHTRQDGKYQNENQTTEEMSDLTM
jgi:hypothetical protein